MKLMEEWHSRRTGEWIQCGCGAKADILVFPSQEEKTDRYWIRCFSCRRRMDHWEKPEIAKERWVFYDYHTKKIVGSTSQHQVSGTGERQTSHGE